MTDPSRQSIFPALRYRDANAAIGFLIGAFGFDEKEVHRGDDGSVQHAELQLEGSVVMLGQHSDGGWMGGSAPDPLASTVSIYAIVADPDAHHARAVDAGASVVRELTDTDYGSREYSARDLEGNLWSFGSYDPAAAG